jgi:alcohol dehydrogenase (cytochrome c)
MLLRPELSKNALTSGIFKSSLIATNIATGYYEYIVKLTFLVYLIEVKFENGTSQKIVIGHDKRGDVMTMDAATGKPLWSNVIGTLYRTDAIPMINGSGEIWPGTQYGIEAYSAADKNGTVYVASSSMGFNFFVNGTGGHVDPVFDTIANGVGNGTITAIDIKTGKIKWQHPTEFPTWVSPLVTNGVVFSGHITATGKPYQFNEFGAPTQTPLISSGIIMALDKDTGKTLWQYNVGAPIGIGGPSIGHGGMLLVTTGSPAEISSNTGGYIVAFALPRQASRSQFFVNLTLSIY